MKILLDIPDNKAASLLEVLKDIPYLKIEELTNDRIIEHANSFFTINETDSMLNFFYCQSKLEELGVARGTNSICDIAEFICSKYFDITLCASQRNEGYDAVEKGNKKKRIQIKINNRKAGTNQNIGNINNYDYLYLLLTSNSLLFNKEFKDSFILIYKIKSSDLKGKSTIAKAFLSNYNPEIKLNSKLEKI